MNMKTTENHLEYWKRMKENARKQNTQLAFGFWSGVIAASTKPPNKRCT